MSERSSSGGRRPGGDPAEEWREVYEALARRPELEEVHELIARKGPEVLRRGVPWLLIRARLDARSTARRQRRRARAAEDAVPPPGGASLWDPYERVVAAESLSRLLAGLAELPLEDALLVWWHAEGRSDTEVAAQWQELGLAPKEPSAAALRKRRERARKRLREHLAGETEK